MKAKDTVMNDTTKRQFIYIKNKADGNLRGFLEDEALEAQAEISFNASREETTGKIFEEIEHQIHKGNMSIWNPCLFWQALKDRLLKEEK